MNLTAIIPTELSSHLWQSTLFAAVAGLLAFSLRRNSARIRYALWLISSLKFLIPFSIVVAAGRHLQWWRSPLIISHPAISIAVAIEQIGRPFERSRPCGRRYA